MNNSIETARSPRGGVTYNTPMARADLTASQKDLRQSPRHTKTPQGNGLKHKSARKNKKAVYLKEMMAIYGDMIKNGRPDAQIAG